MATDDTSKCSCPSDVPEALRIRYEASSQAHVFQFLDNGQLTRAETASFLSELDALSDLAALQQTFSSSLAAAALAAKSSDDSTSTEGASTSQIAPLDAVDRLYESSEAEVTAWTTIGLAALARNQVASVLLAGGQGTRLGFDGPKGCFPIGPVSQASLFELMATRLLRLTDLVTAAAAEASPSTASSSSPVVIPWYIMTSPMNHAATVAFFKHHHFFGLSESQVFFFAQGTLPCMTPEGKLMLATPSSLSVASDGNGGIYPALKNSGALADMTSRGVTSMHVFAVDNALVKIADPTFIGYCLSREADCGNKVVWKSTPEEKVGMLVKRNGRVGVIEYNELDTATKALRENNSPTAPLVYGAGNICNHFYTLTFLHTILVALETSPTYHVAHKKIPTVCLTSGALVKPDTPNGIKLESFIFDVFPLATNMAVLAVNREEEFAPVKNAPGSASDSPDTAMALLSSRAMRWIQQAGGQVMTESTETAAPQNCEIATRLSYNGEGLTALVNGKTFHLPLLLE